MRQKCGLKVDFGIESLLWECKNNADGCLVGFFADVRIYRCNTCAAQRRGLK